MINTGLVFGSVIITTPQKVAFADPNRGLTMIKQPQIKVPILGVVENMSDFTPDELPENKYYRCGKEGGRKLS